MSEPTTTPAATPTVFTEDEARRLRGVLGTLRYSGTLAMGHQLRNITTADQLTDWLALYAEYLADATDRVNVKLAEFDQLNADLGAAGRLLARVLPPTD